MTPRASQKAHVSDIGTDREWTDTESAFAATVTNTFEAGKDRLSIMLRYATQPPGKLLRPRFLLQFAELVGGDASALLPAAVAVELGHLGSLVHDDIIDRDDYRHGKHSVQHEYGADDALVAGDGLFFRMFGIFAELTSRGIPAPAVVAGVRVIASIGQSLCEGQILEAEATRLGDFSTDTYLDVVKGKTASYFSGVARLGVLLAGGSEEHQIAAAQFGKSFGVSFQMIDDLLPFRSTDAVAGKPLSSDLQNGRITFPLVVAHRIGGTADRAYLQRQEQAGREGGATDFEGVHRLLRDLDAFAACGAELSAHTRSAADALDVFPDSLIRERLRAVLAQVEYRVC